MPISSERIDNAALDEEALFHEARRIDPGEARAAFLGRACGARAGLRDRVEALLRVLEQEAGFLEGSAVLADAPTGGGVERVGSMIGPYTLLEVLGEGGMGVVYVAERRHPVRRKAALKIIKPGMDTKQVVARFEAERQALALMDHPNIAKVFNVDATESGRPYFVMELVSGIPVTDYCDRQRLSIPERLALFVLVCRAVQHAHQKGVIHRDLKPSNILVATVDGAAAPKIIDFGIAKAAGGRLTDRTLYTELHQLVGTPLYMSPEQAELSGIDVDTRGDVYSLGVVLYELLTGATPIAREQIGKAGYDEVRRMIREQEPPTPSARLATLGRKRSQAVRGELDWIVMKAIEKDRGRRYESAGDFAADVTRHLTHQPVEACPPSPWYRFRKSARRNRALLTTSGLVALALLIGTVVSTWQAVRAVRAERRTAKALESAQHDRRRAERHLYAFGLRQARQAIEEGQVERAQEVLASLRSEPSESDLRGFAWRYLWRLGRREIALFRDHQAKVFELAISPDGRLFASGDVEGTIIVSDVASEEVRARLTGHTHGVEVLAFSPDGRLLASAAKVQSEPARHGVWIWDVATAVRSARLPAVGRRRVIEMAFTASGRRLVIVWKDPERPLMQVDLFDLQADRGNPVLIRSETVLEARGFALAPSQLAATPVHGAFTVFDAETLKVRWTDAGRTPALRSPTFSADGRCVAAQNGRAAVVWDASTGRERNRVGFERASDASARLRLSPNGGSLLVIDGTSQVSLFNLAGGPSNPPRDLLVADDESYRATEAAFSADGSKLAVITGHDSGGQGPLTLWDAAGGRLLGTYHGRSRLHSRLAFASDGRSLFINGGSGVQRWWFERAEAEPPEVFEGHADEAWSAAFSPTGRRLATGSNDTDEPRTIKLWDSATGRLRLGWNGGNGTVTSLAFAPDGETLASAHLSETGTIRLWEPSTGRLLKTLGGRQGNTRAVAFHPDGLLLASAGDDRVIRLWHTATGDLARKLEGHTGQVRQVAFSPDGNTLASACYDQTARLWDVASGAVTHVVRHSEKVTAVGFSPDGAVLATTDELGTARLWETASGSLVRRIHAENAPLRCVRFSPDGRAFATAGDEGSIRLWDVLTGQELLVLHGDGVQVNAVEFSPDARALASCDHHGAVRLWRTDGEAAFQAP